MEEKVSGDASSVKNKVRTRSASYPSYSIEVSLDFTTRINDAFTAHGYTPKEAISKELNTSGGSFLQQLASAVQYGLLELKFGEGYRPSDLFQKINKPLPSENKRDFLLQSFNTPELYQKLIAEFRDKKLPSESGLTNILDRLYEVKGNAAIQAAKVFFKNLYFLEVVTDDSILKLDSYLPFTEEVSTTPPVESITKPKEQQVYLLAEEIKTPLVKPTQSKEIPVFLAGENREARVSLPHDFTEDDMKKIVKVLSAYLP